METTVISISRALAAGGDEIARDVAKQLDFRFVDDEIIERAAEKAAPRRAGLAAERHGIGPLRIVPIELVDEPFLLARH